MRNFIKVGKLSELPHGQAKVVKAAGTEIAVFNLGGKLWAIDNACPHVDGPLAEGDVCGDEVVCPWHGARFKITTGEVLDGPTNQNVHTYPVRIEGDEIIVEV